MNEYIGKHIGVYQILEQIGQGGMATIFKAYQPSMDRYVALKILPTHFTKDETFLARFNQEARTLARLEHPHILPVHDYGEQEGITYLVMRYIHAGTLKDLIAQRGALPLNETVRILNQVGRALGYAHSQGVVHRDIKPSNVLIDERGDAFLTDFGIAKLVEGTVQYTATGAIVGTPSYMSPEQGQGEPADSRSDIYSLGVMLYEMATGRVPYEAETPLAVLLKHVNAPLPPPRQLKPDVPEGVERVILKAMAKSPGSRYQTAEEMVEALQKAAADVSTEIIAPRPSKKAAAGPPQPTLVASPSSEPTVVTAPSGPPARPLPWLWILGGVAILAAVFVAVWFILPQLGGPPATPTVSAAQATPTPVATAPAATEPAASAAAQPGWTSYTNGNFVSAVARQGDYLWAGGSGGLVRWNLKDGSYVQFGMADGLASNRVNDVLVDDQQAVWVATDAGLNRYDGQTWLTFDETDGLDSDEVQALFVDDDGALWAGTAYGARGLNYYDGSAWTSPPVPPLPFEFPQPQTFAVDQDGRLFVGLLDDGMAYLQDDKWVTLGSAQGLPNDHVYDVLFVDDGELLISLGNEVVRFNSETKQWEAIPQLSGKNVQRMHRAQDQSLWFVGGAGAIHYKSQMGDWQEYEAETDAIPAIVTDIVEDEHGLWLGTYGGGVVLYDGAAWKRWATEGGPGGNTVFAIRQDGSGAIWFAHGDGDGLSRYNQADDTWQAFGEYNGAVDWPYHLGVDGQGHIWAGNYEKLKWYDGANWQEWAPEQLDGAGSISEIEFGAGDVRWLHTDAGVMRYDPASDTWTTFSDPAALKHPSRIHAGRDGAVWVVGDEGKLLYYDGTQWGAPGDAENAPEFVEDIANAPDGGLWMVADSLYHLRDNRWRRFDWPGKYVARLAVGPDGAVWAGYKELGIFDPASNQWQGVTTKVVYPEIAAIYVTPEGVVWIGTKAGIIRYAPEK